MGLSEEDFMTSMTDNSSDELSHIAKKPKMRLPMIPRGSTVFSFIFFSRFYTYFIIQYSSWLSSRAGPDLAEW
jgi:hypothetical protein